MRTSKNTLHRIAMIGVAALALVVSACKPTEVNMQHDYPSWQAHDISDIESSMTITGKLPVSLQSTADTTDLVGAFFDDECWGVTKVQMIDGHPYFFLYINRPRIAYYSDEETSLTLRYYCASTRYIYVLKDAVVFNVDGHIGTVKDPYIPMFSDKE